MYDLIIIGSGPAGISAGIYAKRRELRTLLIGKEMGGQMSLAGEIENYPGFKSIQAFELVSKFIDQVASIGVEVKNEEVINIEKSNSNFLVKTAANEFLGKSVILALGMSPKKLGIPGEAELTGRGVCYCANCDGPLYRNKTVAVIGGGNCALDAAEVLSKIASNVFLIHRDGKFNGFENLVEEVSKRKNIEIYYNSVAKEIIGDKKVEKLIFAESNHEGLRELAVDGIFVEIGKVPQTALVKNLVSLDDKGQIIVDDECKTSVEGMFAAGDATDVAYKQITIASGQGTIAALAAYKHLQ